MIDIHKKYELRDKSIGRVVGLKILEYEDYPIHGKIVREGGVTLVAIWTAEGKYYKNRDDYELDLVEVV
ncbi:MAG: hypothetical protein COB24_08950 [Hyphomicrobiales bacterium]|nr:MAG: hypothetical protein COB24_08950 [Hyphomicrobiales bacterium]